jgi:hypothetical protein
MTKHLRMPLPRFEPERYRCVYLLGTKFEASTALNMTTQSFGMRQIVLKSLKEVWRDSARSSEMLTILDYTAWHPLKTCLQ